MVNYNQVTYIAAWIVIVWCILFIIAKRKLKAVELNSVEEYVKYDYTETQDSYGSVAKETITATYKSDDVFVSEKDGKGNLLKLTANNVVQLENVYDKKGQLDTLKDKVSGKNYKFERDELDNVTAVYEVDGSDVQISSGYGESVVYDELGSVKKKTIVGPVSQVYDYTYKTNSLHTLESIAVGNVSIKPETDVQGRNKGKSLYINNVKVGEENISYRKVSDHATNMPSTVWFGDKTNGTYQIKDSIRYAYDKMGNIEKVYENGELAIRYQYDALNRLVREDNKVMNKTVLFSYDNNGNILKQRKFAFTLKNAIDIEELDSEDKVYIYDGDKLVAFNGEECAYNETTNVQTTYRGKTLGWTNRRVTSYNGIQFSYDGQGRRIAKDGISYIYDSQGRLLKQSNDLEFFYDHSGVSSVKHGENTYFYRKDIQGNIIALLDTSGAVVVKYTYDAWGNNVVSNANNVIITDANHIGNLNPFRYRGYYYDTETALYYLQSRYYSPDLMRFISQDDAVLSNAQGEPLGSNLYVYCLNNPVNFIDNTGYWYYSIKDFYNKKVSPYLAKLSRRSLFKQVTEIQYKINYSKYTRYRNQLFNNIDKLGNFSGYIYGQGTWPFLNMKFVDAKIKDVGCETIAIYNVLKKLGKYQYYPEVLIECYMNNLAWNNGNFGINPKNIYKYFDAHNISYKKTINFKTWNSRIKTAKAGILSFWYIRGYKVHGIHTVMVVYKNKKYYIYNAYNNSINTEEIKNLEELEDYMGGSFIIGYTF